MSEQTLKRLVGGLVVLIVIWVVSSLFGGGRGSIGSSGAIVSFFEGIDTSAIQAVRLTQPTGTVELIRGSDGWTANGFDANEGSIERLFRDLSITRGGDLAATNPANHERMGVSADSAATLEIEMPGDTRTLLVGKQGPRFATVYGRLPDGDAVYVIEGDIRGHVRRALDDWRNTEVVAIDTSAVARVEIERDGDRYTLVRGDSAWTFEDGSATNATQLRNVLIELSSVIAAGFLTEDDSLYAEPQGGANRAYAADGRVLAELTIGSGDGERWVRTVGNDTVYRLSTFRVGRLAPTRETVAGGP